MSKLIILSGMSGVGKDTVAKILMQKNPKIVKVKTCTTRKRRVELNGKLDNTYFYLNEKKFKQMIEKNQFLEWAYVHGKYYGSPIDQVQKIWKNNKLPLLVIDVQGLESVQKIYPENIVSIFIQYDPETNLVNRLKTTRPGISDEEIKIRLKSSQTEKLASNNYQFQVINPEGRPEIAADQINKIIIQNSQ